MTYMIMRGKELGKKDRPGAPPAGAFRGPCSPTAEGARSALTLA
jgi:hypothetical protein